MIERHLLAVALLATGSALAQPSDPGLYLFRIPTSAPADTLQVQDELLRVDLTVRDPESLLARLSATSVVAAVMDEQHVQITVGPHETLRAEPAAAHRAASFVIDFDQEPVVHMLDALVDAHGTEPAIDVLVDHVHAEVRRKSYRRGFDLASQVARSREGDCTEHAVLLAALSRASGYPARVVLGILMMSSRDRLLAFGHAWTVIYQGSHWQIADATRPDLELRDVQVRYVPVMELADEGPGYGLALLDMATLYPQRVAVR
ncbi:MAG TPA: transglutaminase-like domain-containing protein [Steroidobacteraceae bacterium]|nr:transglutaminase-like domain-containing protein [Steroidobacteraceae bacterium]